MDAIREILEAVRLAGLVALACLAIAGASLLWIIAAAIVYAWRLAGDARIRRTGRYRQEIMLRTHLGYTLEEADAAAIKYIRENPHHADA